MSANVKQVYDANPSTTAPDSALMYLGLSPYAPTDNSAILVSNFLAQINLQMINPQDVYWVSKNGDPTAGDGSFNNPFSDLFNAEDEVSDATPSVFILCPGAYSTTELRYKRNRNYAGLQENTVFLSDTSGAIFNDPAAWSTLNGEKISFTNISISAGTNFSIDLVSSSITAPVTMILQKNYFGNTFLLEGADSASSSLAIKSSNNVYAASSSVLNSSYYSISDTYETSSISFTNASSSGITEAYLFNSRMAGLALEANSLGIVEVFLINSRPSSSPAISGAGATLTMDDASYVSPTITNSGLFSITGGIRIPVSVAVSGSKTFALSDLNTIQEVSAAATLTVPLNSAVPIPANGMIAGMQTGAGAVVISPFNGSVIINSISGFYKLAGVGARFSLVQSATINTWNLSGDLIA